MTVRQTWFRWGPSEFDHCGRRVGGEMPLDPRERGIAEHLIKGVRWDACGRMPTPEEINDHPRVEEDSP